MQRTEHYQLAEKFAAKAGEPNVALSHQEQYARLALVHATLATVTKEVEKGANGE